MQCIDPGVGGTGTTVHRMVNQPGGKTQQALRGNGPVYAKNAFVRAHAKHLVHGIAGGRGCFAITDHSDTF